MGASWRGRDVWAGALFIAIGASAAFLARNLAFGTAMRMGPGYVPRGLAVAVMALGAIVLLRGLLRGGPAVEKGRWRPLLIVLGAILAFGLLIERAGLVAAGAALVVAARFADDERRPLETLAFAAALALAAAALFVYLLGLPYRVWPEFG